MTKRARRPAQRVISDPRAIKALAHPARLAVLDALSDGGELTATECAEVAGLSPSAMSYHLRALEKWGFVERVASAADGRERPWRVVPGGWRVDSMNSQVAVTATNSVVGTMLDRVRADTSAWFDREAAQPDEWRSVASVENSVAWLTIDEAEELERRYRGFLDERRGRTAKDHPDDARRVRVTRVMVPLQFD
jgi:DNA-binding transcriptional ArsR family regulator